MAWRPFSTGWRSIDTNEPSMHEHRCKEWGRLITPSLAQNLVRRLTAVYLAAVPLNYLWELGQSPLYRPPSPPSDILWHCFIASLGDGLLVCVIYLTCALVFRRVDWSPRSSASRYVAIAATGFAISVLVEWAALLTARWAYADAMPLLPGLEVGVVPVIQMMVLPVLAFWMVNAWHARRRPAA